MFRTRTRLAALLLALLLTASLAACSGGTNNIVGVDSDLVAAAEIVKINGSPVATVEARQGAFEGKAGDTIEFLFPQAVEINSVFIHEKTTSVRQFNIYVETGDGYKLVYTGKRIVDEACAFPTETATALKVEILNTEIGDDHFVIGYVSAFRETEAN